MNDRIYIEGGHQLKGSIRIQGSKNAALPMMAASLLHRGVSVLKGCPRIADVFCMEEILQKLGAVTWWEDHDLYMDCENAGKWSVPFEFTGRMRSSVILLGALLARNGKGSLGYPGGPFSGPFWSKHDLNHLQSVCHQVDFPLFFFLGGVDI